MIRAYQNGAGPSAIFRYGRAEPGVDVFGIVDPVRWRIQFYTLNDWSTAPDAPSFASRWHEVGDCGLPPGFRLWRVHLNAGTVVLQSQPEVPAAALTAGSGAAPALVFRKVTLQVNPEAIRRVVSATTTPGNRPSPPCGDFSSLETLPAFDAADSATRITGGQNDPFRIERASAQLPEQGEFGTRAISLVHQGRFLSSVQELEAAHTVNSHVNLRHFLLTTRIDRPGFLANELVLVRQGAEARFNARLTIDIGWSRVKMGQRIAAISSVGEVLIMGAGLAANKNNLEFDVFACSFANDEIRNSPCVFRDEAADTPGEEQGRAQPSSTQAAADATPQREASWPMALRYANQIYEVDTSSMPAECREIGVCNPMGNTSIHWTPPSEFRLAEGIVRRRGVPYAQNSDENDRPELPIGPMSVQRYQILRETAGQPYMFGDIENTSINFHFFGIDCSAFISRLWGLGTMDTTQFIESAGARFRRLSGWSDAHLGDAFGIRIEDEHSHALTNHIVMYREARPAGPSDSSRAILVVESASSCGGVCWSFYDESFFHGWAPIRNEPSRRPQNSYSAIPTTVPDWNREFKPAPSKPN